MGTKNNPGKYDCYAKADPDEEIFTLRAKDRHAPTLVWLWSALRELDGEDAECVAEARASVVKMLQWQADHERKAVGLGQATLAGVLELIRAVNGLMKLEDSLTQATDLEVVRRFLAQTEFEK
jgi:hypothetical protein